MGEARGLANLPTSALPIPSSPALFLQVTSYVWCPAFGSYPTARPTSHGVPKTLKLSDFVNLRTNKYYSFCDTYLDTVGLPDFFSSENDEDIAVLGDSNSEALRLLFFVVRMNKYCTLDDSRSKASGLPGFLFMKIKGYFTLGDSKFNAVGLLYFLIARLRSDFFFFTAA